MRRLSVVAGVLAVGGAVGGCEEVGAGFSDAAVVGDGSSAPGQRAPDAGAGASVDAGGRAASLGSGRDASADGVAEAGSMDGGADGSDDAGQGGRAGGGAEGGVDGGGEAPSALAPPCEVREASVRVEVGPAGGEIEGPDCVTLRVREGTLSEPSELGVRRAEGVELPLQFQALGPVYELTPGAQDLSIPAVVTLPFDLESLPAFLTSNPRAGGGSARTPIRDLVVLHSADGSKWAELPGRFVGQALRAEVWGLGSVALATRRRAACTFALERRDLRYTYVTNAQGMLESLHEVWSPDRGPAVMLDELAKFEYDDRNRLTTATSRAMALGDLDEWLGAGLDLVETTTFAHSYTSTGEAEIEVVEEVGADVSSTYTRVYDANGNLLSEDVAWSYRDDVWSTRHTYVSGVLARTEEFFSDRDPHTVVTYDAEGREISRMEPSGGIDTVWVLHRDDTYDDDGFLTQRAQRMTDGHGRDVYVPTTVRYTRDRAGRLLESESISRGQDSFSRTSEAFEYDAAGHVTREVRRFEDASGTLHESTLTFTRDADGRALVEERAPKANGYRITRSYEHDLLQREERRDDRDGDGAYDQTRTVTHTYEEGLETSRVEEVDADGDGTVDALQTQTATYEGECAFAGSMFDALWRRLPIEISVADN